MELKEYLQIIKKNLALFILTIIIVIMAIFAYFYLSPISYSTSLALNVSRQGTQNTDQFKYDDFYRLQADEKFVETIVEWLHDPRIVTNIYSTAGISTQNLSLRQLQKSFVPEKLSSQMVTVNFSTSDRKTAERISGAIVSVISKTNQDLNKDQKEDTWFEIAPQDPLIVQYKPDFKLVLLGSMLAGLFLAFLTVMVKYYLS